MKKYSREWKIKEKAWVQSHNDSEGDVFYKIHYIENDTEYSTGVYYTKNSAMEDLTHFKNLDIFEEF